MAASLKRDRRQSGDNFVSFANPAVAVAQTGLTTLLEMDTRWLDRLFAVFAVTVQALDQFEIQARPNPGAAYITLYSSTAHYGSPSGPLLGTSGDLSLLAAAATGWFMLDVQGIDGVRVQASSDNAAGSVVDVQAGAC